METLFRHLASFSARILSEVRDINKRLVNLSVNLRKMDFKPPVEPIGKRDYSKREEKQSTPDFPTELHIPDTIIGEWKSDSQEKANREKFAIGVSVLTLFALLAYTWVNYHMLEQMERANRSTEKSFKETLVQMQSQTVAQQTAADAAKCAADTTGGQLKSFQAVEGAHLGVGQPRGDIQAGEIGIPIENYGHIPSPRAWVYPHIDRFIPARNGRPTKVLYSKHYTFFGDQTQIPPGSRSDVRYGVTIPLELKPGELESLRAGDEQLWIGISIKYDDGFGNMSQPGICFSWNRAHPAIWDACPVTSFAEMQKARP